LEEDLMEQVYSYELNSGMYYTEFEKEFDLEVVEELYYLVLMEVVIN
jgi:hypothetical protein